MIVMISLCCRRAFDYFEPIFSPPTVQPGIFTGRIVYPQAVSRRYVIINLIGFLTSPVMRNLEGITSRRLRLQLAIHDDANLTRANVYVYKYHKVDERIGVTFFVPYGLYIIPTYVQRFRSVTIWTTAVAKR